MANFTGQPISESYQRVLQIDGGVIQDGLGNTVDATINSLTGSLNGSFNGSANISSSLTVTGSTSLYNPGSTVLSVNGAQGEIFNITDDTSGDLLVIQSGSTDLFVVSSSGEVIISGSISFGDGSQIQSLSASSGDGYGYTTLQLKPDTSLLTDQYLILDPTSPNHIHLRAGGAIDSSSAYLYLGGEKSNVVVRNLDNSFNEKHWVQINSQTGSTQNTWTFDADGTLTISDLLQLPVRTTDPGTPVEGMIMSSGSAGSSKLYYYNGTTWVDLTA